MVRRTPINAERFVCHDCGTVAPEHSSGTEGSSLISLQHGWGLRRHVDANGVSSVEARCAACHARFKKKAPASSFRATGLVFQAAREFQAERVPGGCDAVRARLDRSLVPFYDQQFLSAGAYDVMPILGITEAAAQAASISFAHFVRENAEWQARRDLRGVYRLLLSFQSVQSLVQKLPALSLKYFDFGRAEGKVLGAGAYEAVRSGIPESLSEWFDLATAGFVPVVLQSAGASAVDVRVVSTARDGESNGVKLLRTTYQIHWS